MKNIVLIMFALAATISSAQASDYKTTINGWDSYKDVAQWMKNDWRFDTELARDLANQISRNGPSAGITKSAEETFNIQSGWCKDSARFSKDTLNNIDPDYKAAYIFIKNKLGIPHHWVTGFRYNGELYVIDYGAGPHWSEMMGVHGPYNSIEEYGEFLSSISVSNFELESVKWIYSKQKMIAIKKASTIAFKRAKVVLGKFDRNSDDQISYEEAPKPMKNNFKRLDANNDEYLDEKELRSLAPRK